MSKVTALNAKSISPEIVLNSLYTALPEMDHIYVVVFNKDGTTNTYASGDLSKLAYAAMVLQDLGLKFLNGCVIYGDKST